MRTRLAGPLLAVALVAGCSGAPSPASVASAPRSAAATAAASRPRPTAVHSAPAAASSGRSVATPPAVASDAVPSVPAASVPGSSVAVGPPLTVPETSVVDWGVIWDALPDTFPQFPGARPGDTGGGPASAILDLPADGPTAKAWYVTALQTAGFTVTSATGPREDGTYDVQATRENADCQTEVSLAPLGTTTTATIYVAAACPFR